MRKAPALLIVAAAVALTGGGCDDDDASPPDQRARAGDSAAAGKERARERTARARERVARARERAALPRPSDYRPGMRNYLDRLKPVLQGRDPAGLVQRAYVKLSALPGSPGRAWGRAAKLADDLAAAADEAAGGLGLVVPPPALAAGQRLLASTFRNDGDLLRAAADAARSRDADRLGETFERMVQAPGAAQYFHDLGRRIEELELRIPAWLEPMVTAAGIG